MERKIESAATKPRAKTKTFTVELRRDWCKGCYFCIEICPVEGLFSKEPELGEKGFRPVAVDDRQCLGCMQCELLCPDLAITVVPHATD